MMEEKCLAVLPQHPAKASVAPFQENYLQPRNDVSYGRVVPISGFCQCWQ
jgi:hypothetical protein